MSTPEALAAKLESLKDGIARIESALQRNYENVNVTRHNLNGAVQTMYNNQDITSDLIRDLNRNLQGVIEMAASYRAMQLQVTGGSKVARFLWPVIVGLALAAGIGGGVYFGVR